MFGKLNMAILGCGNIASLMAETMRKVSSVKSYAVASRDLDKAKAFAKQHGFKKAYGSYEELLRDKKVDLVYIATPHSEHYANAKLCIEYGKHVLCEKSFMVSEKQAQEIFALADEKNVLVTEAMWTRYMPMYAKIREVLSSRVIGDPVMLTANLAYNIRWVKRMMDPNLAGGALLDVGVYTLHFASMMFGNDVLKINANCTYTETGVDEQDSIALTYRDGRMAVLNASMIGVGDRQGVIQGTKGYMVIENINNFESVAVYDNAYNRIGFYKRPKQKTGYEYEIQACVRAIKAGWLECPEMPHEETLTVMRMMDEVRRQFGIIYPFERSGKEETESRQADTPQAENREDDSLHGAVSGDAVREQKEEPGREGTDAAAAEYAGTEKEAQTAGEEDVQPAEKSAVSIEEEPVTPVIQATQEAIAAAEAVPAAEVEKTMAAVAAEEVPAEEIANTATSAAEAVPIEETQESQETER